MLPNTYVIIIVAISYVNCGTIDQYLSSYCRDFTHCGIATLKPGHTFDKSDLVDFPYLRELSIRSNIDEKVLANINAGVKLKKILTPDYVWIRNHSYKLPTFIKYSNHIIANTIKISQPSLNLCLNEYCNKTNRNKKAVHCNLIEQSQEANITDYVNSTCLSTIQYLKISGTLWPNLKSISYDFGNVTTIDIAEIRNKMARPDDFANFSNLISLKARCDFEELHHVMEANSHVEVIETSRMQIWRQSDTIVEKYDTYLCCLYQMSAKTNWSEELVTCLDCSDFDWQDSSDLMRDTYQTIIVLYIPSVLMGIIVYIFIFSLLMYLKIKNI